MKVRGHGLTPTRQARLAGALYLAIIICGIGSEVLVRSSLIVPGDAAATAGNIRGAGMLFRAGFAADVIMLFCDVALAVLLYRLFRPVSPTLSLMAAAFRLMQAAILGFNLLNYHAALLLLGGAGYAAAFEPAQLHALASFFLELHGHGYDLGLLFFGVSNLILGYLVIRSGYLPSLFGYALQAAAVVYLVGSSTRFLVPEWLRLVQPAYVVPLLAELGFCQWLLTRGVRTKRCGERESS
ncbi:MAG: DUF4386 domain-containing protein [Acidihalobacter sp.]